jgi:ABC-type sugar transport system substrate-binding protein
MRSSRVRELALPLSIVFASSALLTLIVLSVLAVSGVELGINLAVAGLLLCLLLPMGLELRSRSSRPRRVLFLDFRRHQYGQGVAAGAVRVLNTDKRQWLIDVKAPDAVDGKGAVQWQIRELEKAIIEDVDGVIIIPAEDREDLWHALATVVKSGAMVVALDNKPPNNIYRRVGLEPPRFVSARYQETGTLIGGWLAPWMAADPQRNCILWIGPEGSWAGEERSRQIIYSVVNAGAQERMHLQPLDNWMPTPERCNQTLDLVEKLEGLVAIYCADDENALALHLMTLTERVHLRSRMRIIGCNATPDDWGNIPAVDMHAVDVTVDILAQEQGAEAARLLVRERYGKLSSTQRSVFITPHLLVPGAREGRWLDRIFEGLDHEIHVDSHDVVIPTEPADGLTVNVTRIDTMHSGTSDTATS